MLILSLLLYLRDRRKLPLCIALFVAPTLQYGLVLFSAAIIATILIKALWTEIGNNPRDDFYEHLRSALIPIRDMFWPCASFAAGCAVALLTLSGQWYGSGWASSGYLQQFYYQGDLYNPVPVAEFVTTRLWWMIGYQVWEIIVALALVSFAAILAWPRSRLRFNAIPVLFLLSIVIASCAALLKAYPIGDIRQNIYLGPVVFVVSGYALHSVVSKFTPSHAIYWAILSTVIVTTIGRIYALTETEPCQGRNGVKQALAVLEAHRQPDDVAYVGRYASPIVQFYNRPNQEFYFHGNCVGSDQMDVEECARDLIDKIRVILYSRAHIDSPAERLFLIFHDEVSAQTLDELIGEFYEDDIELEQVSGGTLYVILFRLD